MPKVFPSSLTAKAVPVAADKVLIADSAASEAAKYATLGALPVSTLQQAALDAKMATVPAATEDNFASFDAAGSVKDSGSKASDFATAAQGALADTALQDASAFASSASFIAGAGALTGPAAPLTIGTAAASAVGDFATSAKFVAGAGALTGPAAPLTIGTAAASAVGDFATSAKFVAGAGALTGPAAPLTIGTAAASAVGDFATAAQGATADTALQSVSTDATLTGDGTPGDPLSVVTSGGGGRLFDRVEVKGPLISGFVTYQVASASGSIAGVKITVTDLPTGSSVKVDIRKNGTATTDSIFTSDTEAEITTGTGATNGVYTVTKTTIDNGTFAADDVCRFYVTLIGSTLPGTNLSIVTY